MAYSAKRRGGLKGSKWLLLKNPKDIKRFCLKDVEDNHGGPPTMLSTSLPPFYEKQTFVYLEMPKFNKTESELVKVPTNAKRQNIRTNMELSTTLCLKTIHFVTFYLSIL